MIIYSGLCTNDRSMGKVRVQSRKLGIAYLPSPPLPPLDYRLISLLHVYHVCIVYIVQYRDTFSTSTVLFRTTMWCYCKLHLII